MGQGKEYGIERPENIPLFEMVNYRPKEPLARSRATICLIDDHPQWVRVSCELLAKRGYHALGFQVKSETGRVSILANRALAQAVLSQHPDLVICDVGLGALSGIEVIEYIREVSDDSVITALWTGLGNTRETRKVAHYVLDKLDTAQFLTAVDKIMLSA